VKFPTEDVLACILERARGSVRGLKLPDLDAEAAWVLTEFLDEVQEAIWMDYGDEISDYLDGRGRLDCYHSSEDAGDLPNAPTTEVIDF
jgi:hypothetical protein